MSVLNTCRSFEAVGRGHAVLSGVDALGLPSSPSICPSRADNEDMEKSPPPSGLAVEHLATVCGNGGCPTVYRTNRGTLVVQGYPVEGADVGVDLPAGELLVEIPVDLLEQATRAVS